jgi:MFS superfamily sulfate permease-like transporter
VLVEDTAGRWRTIPAVPGAQSQPGLVIFQFGADLFYANAGRFAKDVRGLVDEAPTPVRWLVLDAGAITSVDYSAARVLRVLLDDLSRGGVGLLLVHAEASLLADLRRHRLTDVVGADQVLDTLRDALGVVRGHPERPRGTPQEGE